MYAWSYDRSSSKQSFQHVEDVEVLILDRPIVFLTKVSRMNYSNQVLSQGSSTLLFSATFSDAVDELVKLSLNRPVRVAVDKVDETTDKLKQEFVQVRFFFFSLSLCLTQT